MNTIYELDQQEMLRDTALVGMPLFEDGTTRFASTGAHDPTSSHYFVLDELFNHVSFSDEDHLLDIGCGLGRVLAYFHHRNFPGKATGVELDPNLASKAMAWTSRFPKLSVISGNVLNIPLGCYTHLYMFNPFDSTVLVQLLDKIEREVCHPLTVLHMSDNGETYYFAERTCWNLKQQGEIQKSQGITVYKHPQHWSIWEYQPKLE